MSSQDKVREILCREVAECFRECDYKICPQIDKALSQLNALYKPLTRERFHSIMCEYSPSIAEDSGQPEWSAGELDKAYDDLVLGKGPWSQINKEP